MKIVAWAIVEEPRTRFLRLRNMLWRLTHPHKGGDYKRVKIGP